MVTPALTLGASAAAARHHSRKSSLVRSLCQKGHARHRFIVTGHKIRRPQSQSLQRMAVSTVSALTEEERQTALQTTLGVTTGSNTMNPHPWTKVRTCGFSKFHSLENPTNKSYLSWFVLSFSFCHCDHSVVSSVNPIVDLSSSANLLFRSLSLSLSLSLSVCLYPIYNDSLFST